MNDPDCRSSHEERCGGESSFDDGREGVDSNAAFAGLRGRIERCREELADLLFEIDHIELQVNPKIRQDYNVKIACYENNLLKAEIEARRAKRKLALARACANRGETVEDCALEEKLESEFSAWEAELESRVDEYVRALESRSAERLLPAREAAELRKTHRLLVKRLHPDANAGREEECERFFLIAQVAYENGDLDSLRSVEAATRHLGRGWACPASESEAVAELGVLEARVNVAKKRLNELKTSNPYLLKSKLDDAAWVTKTVSNLEEETRRRYEARDHYLSEYRVLREAQS